MNKIATDWQTYECLYAGNQTKIERWGKYILQRPDPLAIWPLPSHHLKIDAIYHRSNKGGGYWEYCNVLPENWLINYKNMQFKVSPLSFKHMGLFPEQAANWNSLNDIIQSKNHKEFKVLNLFAYTGGATLACALAGADEVVHVDSSKGMVIWAKENMQLSNLTHKKIRFIVDDCLKFVKKEQRRNNKYQGIILDPPSFGRGPDGEVWKFEEQINDLLQQVVKLLADDAQFFLINTYTTGYSSIALANVLNSNVLKNSNFTNIQVGELAIPITRQSILLPCGIYGLLTND